MIQLLIDPEVIAPLDFRQRYEVGDMCLPTGPGHARVSRCCPAQQVKSGPSRGTGNFETSRDARHISSCECA